jgi:amino acid adenylation domain-containing protein
MHTPQRHRQDEPEGILKWFNDACSHFTERTAVEWRTSKVSYGALNGMTNRIANCLIDNRLSQGGKVVVFTRDRIWMIAALLGIFRSGAVFVPLSLDFPRERLCQILSELSPDAVIISADQSDALSQICDSKEWTFTIIVIGKRGVIANALGGKHISINDSPEKYATQTPSLWVDPQAMRYIYYTSGSTGQPKGIMGNLKSLSHFIQWEIKKFKLEAGCLVSQLSVPTFDVYFRDVLVPLCVGGTVCIPPDNPVQLGVNEFIEWIDDKCLNLIHCVPTLFAWILEGTLNLQKFLSLKYILLSGEVLHVSTVKQWMDIFGDRVQLVNLYGPTETTMVKFFHVVHGSDLNRGFIPIGKPMSGAKAIILDKHKNVCPQGVIGEIYIRTPYMTLGYYKNLDATRKTFITNPFNEDLDELIYKTGDLGKLLDDGNFQFLGRIDNQVKIRGNRVELGDIENNLRDHSQVKQAAAVIKEDVHDATQLVAFFVPASKPVISSNELRTFLKQKLPDYMIPSIFVAMDSLPLNPNGKVDRRILLEHHVEQPDLEEPCVGPRTSTEKMLIGIWADILRRNQVSIHDNFFELGGHSLMATRLASKIRTKINLEMPLRVVFEQPTIAGQAEFIDNEIIRKIT